MVLNGIKKETNPAMTMKKRVMTTMSAAILLAAIEVPALAASPEPILESAKLVEVSRDARTAPEHAAVAKQFRLRAEALDIQAAKHEESARRRAESATAIMGKWPAMAPRILQEDKQKAMEARRAARENHELAEKHRQLSLEALAVR